MNFEKLVEKAEIKVFQSYVDSPPAECMFELSDDLKAAVEEVSPMMRYVRKLVSESLRLYHLEQLKTKRAKGRHKI